MSFQHVTPRRYPARTHSALSRASQILTGFLILTAFSLLSGCGGSHSMTTPPIVLSVTISENPIQITAGGPPVYVQVLIVAPTETTSFAMMGLPGGVSESYKESESNPSGQLTLTANSTTPPGTYQCTVTVGSSGQMASTTVNLVVAPPSKT
jgi:hypothetical protein